MTTTKPSVSVASEIHVASTDRKLKMQHENYFQLCIIIIFIFSRSLSYPLAYCSSSLPPSSARPSSLPSSLPSSSSPPLTRLPESLTRLMERQESSSREIITCESIKERRRLTFWGESGLIQLMMVMIMTRGVGGVIVMKMMIAGVW